MKVLIVDDKAENLYLLRSLLGSKGYEVMEAGNGEQALALARQVKPGLIISDILMPVMDGFAFCRACKADPELHCIPFVFYTATYTEPRDKEFALSLGADLFLVKPQETHVFLHEIADLLDRHQLENKPPAVAEIDDDSFYRQYNVRLVHKLEDKLAEIEQKNRQLAAKEAALREANEALERRVAERTAELTQLNQELSAFNYSVSHDLRSPLFHAGGFAEALLEDNWDQLDEQGRDYLKRISKATSRMADMIDALLQLSRLSQGEFKRQSVDLGALAEAELARLREQDPGREVEISIAPGLEVYGDSRLLEILIDNLVGNAWKYTSQRHPARIEEGELEQEGERVFFVRDNGVGFDMRYVDRLFGPFQRLHGEEFEGIGIGLATVRRIINCHGGRVWAEAAPGEGATFYFTLPQRAES